MNFYKVTTTILLVLLLANAFAPTLLPDAVRAAPNVINCITVGAGLKPHGRQCSDFTLGVKFPPAGGENGDATVVARGDHNHDSRYINTSGDTMTGDLSFGSSTRQMLNLWNHQYGVGVQAYTEYFRTDGGFAWYRGGTHSDTPSDPGAGGTRLLALDDHGSLWQDRTASGLAKAGVLATCHGGDTNPYSSISGYFNNVNGMAPTIWNGSDAGKCHLNLFFYVADRFAVATANGPSDCTVSVWINEDSGMDLYPCRDLTQVYVLIY